MCQKIDRKNLPHACTYAQRWNDTAGPEIRAYFYHDATTPPSELLSTSQFTRFAQEEM